MLRIIARQALTIRRLRKVCDRMMRTSVVQQSVNAVLSQRVEQLKRDVLMVALMVPQERRREAFEFVASAEAIRALDEVQGETS